MSEGLAATTDLVLITQLRGIPDPRMRLGGRIPAWWLPCVAVLAVLGTCQSLLVRERFAVWHRGVLTEVLGIELWWHPSAPALRSFFKQVDVAALCAGIRDWGIAQIPGGAADLDQLVRDGKTPRGSIEPRPPTPR